MILLVGGSVFASGTRSREQPEDLLVSVKQLQSRLDDSNALILDARDCGDYLSGFVAGAVSLPTNDLNRPVLLESGAEGPRIVQEADEAIYVLQDAGINTHSRIIIYDQEV